MNSRPEPGSRGRGPVSVKLIRDAVRPEPLSCFASLTPMYDRTDVFRYMRLMDIMSYIGLRLAKKRSRITAPPYGRTCSLRLVEISVTGLELRLTERPGAAQA